MFLNCFYLRSNLYYLTLCDQLKSSRLISCYYCYSLIIILFELNLLGFIQSTTHTTFVSLLYGQLNIFIINFHHKVYAISFFSSF